MTRIVARFITIALIENVAISKGKSAAEFGGWTNPGQVRTISTIDYRAEDRLLKQAEDSPFSEFFVTFVAFCSIQNLKSGRENKHPFFCSISMRPLSQTASAGLPFPVQTSLESPGF
jgi:hypothetical protein